MSRASHLPPIHQSSPTDVLHYVLKLVSAEYPVDLICVCGNLQGSPQLELLVQYPEDATVEMHHILHKHVMMAVEEGTLGPQILERSELEHYESGLIIPLQAQDAFVGVVGLFSNQANAYTPDDAFGLADPIGVVRLVLENNYLYDVLAQNFIISQFILLTAQTVVDNPSPQQIIDSLRERLFDAHVTSCAIFLYGPVSEDRPYGPFDYLEMVGSWSWRLGSGIALGTKFYLTEYPGYLQRLDNRETLVFTHDLDEFASGLDPFLRSILRAERIRSMTLLPLHAGKRKLGVLMVGSNKRHIFSPQELQNYQTISEFLGISAMSQLLQQQRDLVQQGRAALLDAVTDGVVMVLPDSAGARVLTVNKHFTSIFGLTEMQAQGLLLPDLLDKMQIPETVREELTRMWLSVPVRDPSTQLGEFHMIHAEGYPMDIAWYSAPVYQNSNLIMGRIYTFQNVTAERTAIRVRSAFLSRVSHELRTPLTSIHGFAEFILEATGDDLPPLAREYTEIILNSARHLRTVFTDMIELTRADAGELKLHLQQAHLPDIIINVVAQLELQYKARGQSVVMELDDDLPPVNIDIDRIMQVITNLVANAIKFSPENSRISITTAEVAHPAGLPPSAPPGLMLPGIIVGIIDEGPGIDNADVDEVFVPFFRTRWARQHQIEGTGLGLAVSRSIIELHRGVIWVEQATESAPGGRFFFSLPTA